MIEKGEYFEPTRITQLEAVGFSNMYVCARICVLACVRAWVRTWVCANVRVCKRACVQTCVRACVRGCMCMRARSHILCACGCARFRVKGALGTRNMGY